MKIPKLEDLNNERFLNEAFDQECRMRWSKNARLRRNIYLWLFVVAIACLFYTAIIDRMTLCFLSLFLATISLVVMTKYDTQLYFLNILQLRDEQKNVDPDHS